MVDNATLSVIIHNLHAVRFLSAFLHITALFLKTFSKFAALCAPAVHFDRYSPMACMRRKSCLISHLSEKCAPWRSSGAA